MRRDEIAVSCASCDCWMELETAEGQEPPPEGKRAGICILNPPIVQFIPVQQQLNAAQMIQRGGDPGAPVMRMEPARAYVIMGESEVCGQHPDFPEPEKDPADTVH